MKSVKYIHPRANRLFLIRIKMLNKDNWEINLCKFLLLLRKGLSCK